MFRFSAWRPAGYEFPGWALWFSSKGIATEVRSCAHGKTALFRDGEDAFDSEDELNGMVIRKRMLHERQHGCECDYEGKRKARHD